MPDIDAGVENNDAAVAAKAAADKVAADAAAKATADAAKANEGATPEELAAQQAAADKADAAKKEKDVYAPKISDSAAEQVEGMITAAGLDVDALSKGVADTGKISPAEYMKLVEKYGEGTAGLIANQIDGIMQDGKARAEANDNAVYDHVAAAFEGVTEQTGEESWNELAGWAKTNVPDAERGEINEMLSLGGIAAKLAVGELVSRFQGSDTYTQPAQLEAAGGTASASAGAGIDKATYSRQLDALMAKGHDYNTSPEIAALQRKRTKALKRGA